MAIDNVSCQKTIGRKVVVFGGDFRQILHVISRRIKSDIVHSTINLLYIWDHCKFLKLNKNMRLETGSNSTDDEEIHKLSKWILKVDDGKISELNDECVEITIPQELWTQ